MKTISIPSLHTQYEQWVDLSNAIFVYPTDSIYGLWAYVNAENIQKIEHIKDRHPHKHYSLIAPSYARVHEHFQVEDDISQYRQQAYATYGPITLLCQRRDPAFLPQVSSNWLVWIRIVDHPIQQFIEKIGVPFLSTSANISWEPYNADNLEDLFANRADYYIINDAPMTNQASTLINYSTREVIKR